MKYVRFYLEFDTPGKKRKGEHNGNVFAVFVEPIGRGSRPRILPSGRAGVPTVKGVGAVNDFPNSPVGSCSASLIYLRKNCKKISEKQAREIHPHLFEDYLDRME